MQADERQFAKKKRRGCFFWGCLTLGLFFSLVGGCTAFVVHQTYTFVKREYTADKPAEVPIYQPTPKEWENLQRRIADFRQAVRENNSAELILTADDINAITAKTELAGKAYFNIEGDEVTVLGTVPLDSVVGFSGRYINGTYSVMLSIENGKFVMTPTGLTIGEEKVPSELMENLNLENFTTEINKNEVIQELVTNVNEFYLEDGKLIIRR